MKQSLGTLALGAYLALLSALAPTHVAAQDAPRHDVYVATARCINYLALGGIPISSIMRDDNDAIDAALMRIEDLGMKCDRIAVEVVYLP